MNHNPSLLSHMLAPFLLLVFGSTALAAGPTENVLHNFQGGTDGAVSFAGLVADQAGNVYGTTYWGGLETGMCQADDGCGIVFQFEISGRA